MVMMRAAHQAVLWGALALVFSLASFGPAYSGSSAHEHSGGGHRIRVTPDYEQNEDGLLLTEEPNIYRNALDNNTFLDYQTSDSWDFGVYMLNMPVVPGSDNYDWDSYISIAKFFLPIPDLTIGLGTQNGTTVFSSQHSYHNFNFAKAAYHFDETFTASSGVFYVNNALSGTSQNVGFMLGVDIHLIPDRFWIEMDYQSGVTQVSGSVVNVFYKPEKPYGFYLGVQVPAATTSSDFIGTLGVMVYAKELGLAL